MRVRANAVDVVLDGTPILRDVSVEVTPSEVVGVVGPTAAENPLSCARCTAGPDPHNHLLERDSTDDATIVSGALARVGLTDQAERLYATLSGDEKQLTLLAGRWRSRVSCSSWTSPPTIDIHT